MGTPIYDLAENELPSPVVKKNDNNSRLLPFSFPASNKKVNRRTNLMNETQHSKPTEEDQDEPTKSKDGVNR